MQMVFFHRLRDPVEMSDLDKVQHERPQVGDELEGGLDRQNLIRDGVRGPEKGSILPISDTTLTLCHENLHRSEL